MININTNGLLVDADFLMNYKNFNLSEEEAMFLLQINYLTEQGKKLFSVNSFVVALNLSEQDIFEQINNLLNKKVIRLANDNKIEFLIFTKDDKYYTLREPPIISPYPSGAIRSAHNTTPGSSGSSII